MKQLTKIGLLGFLIIIQLTANAQWSQLGQDIDGDADYHFLGAVATSADGLTVAVGAKDDADDMIGGVPGNGYVRV
ncbi:MAG: hypothetical protein HRT41_16070, partial [Campylobacteraceae bacterium]|nr:hypothetical protein [Campylobacteraceae bacterium]